MTRHHPDHKIEILAGSVVGERCSARELDRIANVGDLVDVAGGVTFHREHDADRWAYLLLDGAVVVSQNGDPLAVAGKGTWFPLGPTNSGCQRARVSLTALHDSQLLVFRWRDLGGVLDDVPLLSPAALMS